MSTRFSGGNGFAGNVFNAVIGANDITATDIALHVDETIGSRVDAFLYFREGGHQGFETDSAA